MIVRPENPIAISSTRCASRRATTFPARCGGRRRRRAAELATYGGMPIPELRALLDELGMRVGRVACALPPGKGSPRRPWPISSRSVGYAVVPFVPEERRGGVTFARSLAADLNRWAAEAKQAGLGFAYHHHDFEFAPLADGDGGTLFDILVQETDPNLVGIEVDVYWAAHAVDPAHLLGERRVACHSST